VIGTLTYGYDGAGRRTRVGGSLARLGLPQALSSASYNDGNRQTGFGAATLTYDDNGKLTSDGTNTYTWNARGQLTAISGPGLAASFSYDAVGRRASKTINGSTTAYLYDGANIAQEITSGSASADLLTGGADRFFSRTDSSGTATPLRDGLGSVMALVDAGGAVQTSYSYEPFGKTTTSGAASSNTQKYTGREEDGTGLYYYRNRYYSPTLQRFISEDPIGLAGGINVYAYVHNKPTRSKDPFGLDDFDAPAEQTDQNSIEYIDKVYEQLHKDYVKYRARCQGRSPDFISFTISAGEAAGVVTQITIDRYGNYYQSPVGAYVGVGSPVGVSLTASWINGYPDDQPPSADDIRNFVLQHSISVGGGALFGATWTYSPGSGSSTDIGLMTPQLSATYTYSFDSPMNDYKNQGTAPFPAMGPKPCGCGNK
jgi:RHS repeat-associated protein